MRRMALPVVGMHCRTSWRRALHPERSEGSCRGVRKPTGKILRCAQDEESLSSSATRSISSSNCRSGPTAAPGPAAPPRPPRPRGAGHHRRGVLRPEPRRWSTDGPPEMAGCDATLDERVVQPPRELGVAIEQGPDPEPPEDAEGRLLGQRREPGQRGVELRGRGREVHGRSVEALGRVAGGLPAGSDGADAVEQSAPDIEVAHAPRAEQELVARGGQEIHAVAHHVQRAPRPRPGRRRRRTRPRSGPRPG